MSEYYKNTLVITQPDGNVMKIHYNADHTVEYTNTNGRSDKGTWRQKDATTICTIIRQAIQNPPPAFEECFPDNTRWATNGVRQRSCPDGISHIRRSERKTKFVAANVLWRLADLANRPPHVRF